MANKDKDIAQAAADPVGQAPIADTGGTQYYTVEQLRDEYKTPDGIFDGTLASKGWRAGRQVTRAVYLAAVDEFLSCSIRGNT